MDSFPFLESQCGIDTSGLKTRPLENEQGGEKAKEIVWAVTFFYTMGKKEDVTATRARV